MYTLIIIRVKQNTPINVETDYPCPESRTVNCIVNKVETDYYPCQTKNLKNYIKYEKDRFKSILLNCKYLIYT